ncbi:MAG: hypothetical protein ACTHLO_05135 [Pseudolabrys sp.]
MAMISAKSWFEAWRFAAQAQQVMAARMMRFWLNDATAGTEATRMVTEKMAAAAEAQFAIGLALMRGQGAGVALRRAATSYRRRVRANHRRLS